jgi:hypothetical protein
MVVLALATRFPPAFLGEEEPSGAYGSDSESEMVYTDPGEDARPMVAWTEVDVVELIVFAISDHWTPTRPKYFADIRRVSANAVTPAGYFLGGSGRTISGSSAVFR